MIDLTEAKAAKVVGWLKSLCLLLESPRKWVSRI